jgi:hypothetical protein
LVRAAIYVENRDRLQETLDQKVVGDDILQVNEVSGRSVVNQSLHRYPHGGLQIQAK